MSEKKIDPLWKEGVLTLLIILPFIMFLFGERIDNNDLFMVYGTDLFIYIYSGKNCCSAKNGKLEVVEMNCTSHDLI